MSAPTIQANYDSLDKIATSFDEQSQIVRDVIQNLEQKYEPLESEEWVGHAATAFYAKMQNEIFPAVRRLQEAMEFASSTTQQLIQGLKSTERESADKFQIR